MYVEADFLFALAKADDWLESGAREVLDADEEVHTSMLAYTEFLLATYSVGDGFDFDVPRTVANLLELVPVRPPADEAVVLTAATFLDEHEMTPFDAFHAAIATNRDGRIASSDRAYDSLDVERVPLESDGTR